MAQCSRADNLLAKVADRVTLNCNDLAKSAGQVPTALNELAFENGDSSSDSFHGLEQCVEDRFFETPEVNFFALLLKETNNTFLVLSVLIKRL